MLSLAIAISFSGSIELFFSNSEHHVLILDMEKDSGSDEKNSEKDKEKESEKEKKKLLTTFSVLHSSKTIDLELNLLKCTTIEFFDKVPSPPPQG